MANTSWQHRIGHKRRGSLDYRSVPFIQNALQPRVLGIRFVSICQHTHGSMPALTGRPILEVLPEELGHLQCSVLGCRQYCQCVHALLKA